MACSGHDPAHRACPNHPAAAALLPRNRHTGPAANRQDDLGAASGQGAQRGGASAGFGKPRRPQQADVSRLDIRTLIPLLASLLAFSAKFLLDVAKRNRAFANCTAMALTIFVGFFVFANYYNFLHQFIIQHSARNLDDSVISEVASLLNNGKYVQANATDWNMEQLKSLNTPYNHQTHWPNSPYGDDSIHKVPPSNPQQPYYILDFMGKPCANGFHSVHANLIGRADYSVLGYAGKLSEFLQGGAPHASIDRNPGLTALGEYHWVIYAISNRMDECAPCLRTVLYSDHGIYSIPSSCPSVDIKDLARAS